MWAVLVFLTVKKIHFSAEVNRILTYIAGIATTFIAFLWLEFYYDAQFWVPIFSIPFLYLVLDIIVYYVIYVLFLLIFNSIRAASICMVVVTAVFGIFNYELTLFRSMSFIASDIYSFVTAVSVANTYQVQIDVDTAEFFMMALVLVALLLKLDKVKLFKWKGRIVYAIVSCMIFAGFTQVYVYSDYLEDIGVDFRVYRPQYKYRYYGTLLTTMRTFGYLHVTQPEEYSVNAVKKITKQYTENESTETQEKNTSTQNKTTKKPNVIAIMNESFADLKAVGDLQTSKDYMPFFRKLKENAIKGYTYSSVFGGNTANSDFEFMTGNTLAFLPDNSVPYQLFLRSKTAGLTYTLKDQGYSPCYALHPFYKTGYGRYKVYPLMGFDKFYTSDNFSVFTDTVNYHITDSEDYKKLISLYENRTDKDKRRPLAALRIDFIRPRAEKRQQEQRQNVIQRHNAAGQRIADMESVFQDQWNDVVIHLPKGTDRQKCKPNQNGPFVIQFHDVLPRFLFCLSSDIDSQQRFVCAFQNVARHNAAHS